MSTKGWPVQIVGTSVIARRLARDRMTICAASAYLEKHGVPQDPEQLLAHAWLGSSSQVAKNGFVINTAAGDIRVRPVCTVVANDVSVLRQCTLRGMGIAALPDAIIHDDVTCGALIPLLLDFPLPPVEIMLVYSGRRHMPANVRSLIDQLLRHFALDSDSKLQSIPR
uniref:LysR substrate-binding domain-containing protein n=1 Tax=Burkholderia arboris TaxID=488730 RepID=UPI003BEEB706